MDEIKTQPLVSVVVPTYNRAYCLGRTLDSVLAQTYRNLEIVLVDDGSTDNTGAFVQERYGDEPRVRYFYQQNRGVSAARNRGLGLAKGDYIALLDSDDVWKPWKLELQVACLRRLPEAGMVWTDMEAVDPSGKVVNPRFLRTMYGAYKWFDTNSLFTERHPIDHAVVHPPVEAIGATLYSGDIYSQMIMGSLVHTSTVLLTRERLAAVRTFREDLLFSGEDYDFHLRTCRAGTVAFVDVASIFYQIGMPDQLTRPEYSIHMAKNFLKTFAPALQKDRARITLSDDMLKALYADTYLWIGQEAIDIGDNRDARKYLALSLWHDWRQVRTLALFLSALFPVQITKVIRRLYASAKDRRKLATGAIKP